MQYLRSAAAGFILILTVIIFLAGCGGHSNTIGPITTITLTPNPTVSVNAGDVIDMTANATDARGNVVSNQTFTFNSDNPGVAQMASTSTNISTLCAGGMWGDNNIICGPLTGQTTFTTGLAHITVTAEGVTSNTVAVTVHPKVARVVVTQTSPAGTCVSQTLSFTYSVSAFGPTGADITSQVGNFTWTIGDSTIGTLANTSTASGASNSVTALLPGFTTVTASVNDTNPVNSAAVLFQECPVASITISPSPAVFTPSPAAAGATQQMSATVMDANTPSQAVSGVTLTWNSSQAAVATVSSSGLVTAVAPGSSNITASCALNSGCNKNQGVLVTSNIAVASVAGSSATSVYAIASTTTSLVPIDTTTNIPGTAITLPAGANSLLFDPQGANAYLGSSSGLMVVNATNNTFTKTVSNAPGKVLAVSPNGQLVLVGGSGNPTALYNASASTVSSLNITNAIAADFSPDSSEVVVADATGVRVVQGTTVRTASNTVTANSVSFLATGALAYLAADTTPSVIACTSTLHTPGPTPSNPTKPTQLVKTSTDGTKMLGAALNLTTPTLQVIAVTAGAGCATNNETLTSLAVAGGTVPAQIITTPDGSHAYVTSDLPGKLISYDGTITGTVALAGTAPTTTTGGATLDSSSVYVGVNDGGNGSVHQISVGSGTDAAQIPLSFVPDLVAVRPH